ncbi:MAG: hypothetical protein GF309_06775 [Candidatus Lokiarchaeota archaeon]|nr:hypothetical protein [Candidatus Lokiarchaeota archaeon]
MSEHLNSSRMCIGNKILQLAKLIAGNKYLVTFSQLHSGFSFIHLPFIGTSQTSSWVEERIEEMIDKKRIFVSLIMDAILGVLHIVGVRGRIDDGYLLNIVFLIATVGAIAAIIVVGSHMRKRS